MPLVFDEKFEDFRCQWCGKVNSNVVELERGK